MKHLFLSIAFLFSCCMLYAQNLTDTDSTQKKNIIVNKDPRMDVLAKKEADINNANGALYGGKYIRGFRLILLNTNNRALALKLRSKLLQHFPDQKVYMSFQPPYIKLKFGDFADKDEAKQYRDQISKANIVSGNIYIVSDLVENKLYNPKQTTTP